MKVPRFVIAGTNSGCGKTTITSALISALKKRGMQVQPFKMGPDYIDTMFHSFIAECDGRNIDSFLFDDDTFRYIFQKNSEEADIAVCEGVMGMYDGIGKTSNSSTAEMSKIIDAPVIMVVNAKGMAVSAAAMVKGFIEFDKTVNVCGVILNNVKSETQYVFLKSIIEEHTDTEVLGYLQENEKIKIGSRHLGLITAREVSRLEKKMDILADEAERTIDIDRILEIAENASDLKFKDILSKDLKDKFKGLRVGIAYDMAFNFYYRDNIDFLNYLGIETEFFSPLKDYRIPKNIDALYIGGGYPELFPVELTNNISMRNSIKQFAEKGGYIYAECGGLIYMSEKIKTFDGNEYSMTGVLKGSCKMGDKLRHFGYVELKDRETEMEIKGHEFHYSIENIRNRTLFEVSKTRGNRKTVWRSGYNYKNVIASYPHIHFYSNMDFVIKFIEKAIKEVKNA